MHTRRPIGIDLFAGAGGLSLGFEQAGFDIVAAVEIDPIHCAVHEFNFPLCTTLCRSAAEITGQEIRSRARLGETEIDVVFGGPPCQGVSLMGKRALDDPRNALMQHFVRLVLELQPRYCVMENVKGLTVGKHRQILEEVIEGLSAGGYDVETSYQVLNAAEFGVPQDRRRVFLMGAKKGLVKPSYPKPDVTPANAKTTSLLPKGPTVLEAIGDLPNADMFEELLERDWVTASFGTRSAYAQHLHSGGDRDDFSYPRRYNPHLMTSSTRTIHTPLSAQRFAATVPGQMEPISRFPRLDPNGVCNTLRAGTGSDRGAYTSPRPIHPFHARCITVREAARIHSYPDWFRLHATKWHGFRQIGNSVPPLLGRAVARQVLQVLGVTPIKPTTSLPATDTRLLSMNMSEAAAVFEVDRSLMGHRLRTV